MRLARKQDAVADEARADAHQHRDLVDGPGQIHAGCDHVIGRMICANDFEQFHHICGREEVEPDHILRSLRDARDLIDIERGGIGREDGSGLQNSVKVSEYLLLQRHVFEHSFDHQIAIGQGLHLHGASEATHAFGDFALRKTAIVGAALIVDANHFQAAIKRLRLLLQDQDRNAGRREVHGDAAAHRARADHTDFCDFAPRRIGWNIRDEPGLSPRLGDIVGNFRRCHGDGRHRVLSC